MKLSYKYKYDRENNQWYGVIIDENGTIITVGVEFTEDRIYQWCVETVKLWPLTGREATDAYDRKH